MPVTITIFILVTNAAFLALCLIALRTITHRQAQNTQPAENILQENATVFRALFDYAPAGIVIVSQDGTIQMLNDSTARMFGYTRSDLLGQPIEILLPEHLREIHARHRAEYITAPQTRPMGIGMRLIGRRSNGEEFPVEVGLTYFQMGAEITAVGFINDISERLHAFKALAEREKTLALSLQAAGAGVWTWDLDSGRVRWDERLEEIHGLETGAFGGAFEDWRALVHPEDLEAAEQDIQTSLTGEDPFNTQFRIIRPDGNIRTILGQGIVLRDADDKPAQMIGVNIDITERASDQLQLRQQRDQIQLLQEITFAAHLAENSGDAIQFALDEICAFTGWPIGHAYMIDEHTGMLISAGHWHLDDRNDFQSFIARTTGLRLSDANEKLIRYVYHSGEPLWISDVTTLEAYIRTHEARESGIRTCVAFPIKSHQAVVGVMEFYTDKTLEPDEQWLEIMANIGTQIGRVFEREQAERRLRQLNADLERRVQERTAHLIAVNKELEAFSYSVSHDLRAPLRAVDGFSQAILEDYHDLLDDMGRDFLNRIRTESQRMGQLIDDLIGLSRISRSEMKVQTTDLSAIVREVITELRGNQPDREVEFDIQDGVIACVDEALIRVVLQNLLENAWKFTAKKPKTRIEFGTQNSNGSVEYYLRDNGAGFDMAYIDKLFGAFQRLHAMDEFYGTGIGLATVQRIIHRHGGVVRAEGEVGAGATFYFTLATGGCQ